VKFLPSTSSIDRYANLPGSLRLADVVDAILGEAAKPANARRFSPDRVGDEGCKRGTDGSVTRQVQRRLQADRRWRLDRHLGAA
jgi:hypothetical protein